MGTDKLILIVLFFIKIYTAASKEHCYYWEIYNGTTPKNAVEGGQDADGNTFYIALVHRKSVNKIVPGMIIPKRKAAYISSYSGVFYIKNNITNEVKILCSENKEVFEWISTSSINLHLITNKNLVSGGSVWGYNLYIGRVRHNGGIVLGKVFPFMFGGLWIPSGDNESWYHTFEVLACDCKKKTHDFQTEMIKEFNIDQRTIERVFNGL